MHEKINEEKTDRKKWLSWTEQSQREDEYQKRYYKYKKCKKKQKKKKQLEIHDWPGQNNHREQINIICKKYQKRNKN